MRAVSSAIVLFSALAALASPHNDRREHAGLAKRMSGDLTKRGAYTNARFTWYPTDTGADACTGKNHKDSDWFVALNMPLFGYGASGNGHCMKQIKITAKGKSTVATIVDACATCYSDSDIDMTKGLFEFFDGNLGDGVFYGSWEFVDGSSGGGSSGGGDDGGDDSSSSTHTTHHTTSTKPKPPPTTYYTPTTTSHYTPTTTPKTTPKTTSTTTTTSDHSSSSASHSNSSSITSTSSTVALNTTSSTTTVTPPTTIPTPNVGNAGNDPSTSSVAGIQGGISDNGPTSGSIKLAFNKAALGLTALALVAVHAL